MRQIGRQVEVGSDALVKKVALAVDQVLVLGTPVNTGRARSNWIAQAGGPATSEIGPYSPGVGLGIGEGANAAAALNQGRSAIASRQPGQDIYISNNVDYIEDLNNGSSAQAPAGFVEQAVDTGRRVARRGRVLK